LRHFRLVTLIAASCRALFDVSPRRTRANLARAASSQHSSRLTVEEVEDIVRALTMIVENLDAGAAKQSMQEAYMQVRAHAVEIRAPARTTPTRQ
jgi:hypothetical protein